MLALIEEGLKSADTAGYPLTRLVAHMEWALLDKPGVDNLVEYETRLNYVLPKYDDPVVCTYDLSKFGANVTMDILRTHPVVIIGGGLQEKPFFVPPNQFLLEMKERRSGPKSSGLGDGTATGRGRGEKLGGDVFVRGRMLLETVQHTLAEDTSGR